MSAAAYQPSDEASIEKAHALLAPFAELCDQLAATTKKLEKRALMDTYLSGLAVEDAARAVLYLAGAPFAETDRRRLQVGGSTLSKAVASLSGASPAAMHEAFRRHGDLGGAAHDLLSGPLSGRSATGPALTLAELEAAFATLAETRGPAAKLLLLVALLARASPIEAKYIIKLAGGDMRTGVKQSLVEEAVAACYGAEAAAVRRAVMLNGNLAEVIGMAAAGTLDMATMRLFHPLGFMLASPVDSVDEALARFAQEVALEADEAKAEARRAALGQPGLDQGNAAEVDTDPARQLPNAYAPTEPSAPDTAASLLAAAPPHLRAAQLEDKYDGMRAQLHCGDRSQPGRVGLFSRNREDLSESFPELIEAFAHLGEEVILDGEILAWNAGVEGEPGRALSFSSLQQRLGRKRVTADMRLATPVVFMAFDLLYQAGELLLERPLSERRARLVMLVAAHGELTNGSQHVPEAISQGLLFAPPPRPPGFARLLLAPAVQLADAAQLDAAYIEARGRGNEGVMLKASASLYQPGRRGLAWLKLKRELATLDVVITGAEFGNGRRAGVLSDYTFAVRAAATGSAPEMLDSASEPPEAGASALLNVGKAYSGLTDMEIDALSRLLMEQTVEEYGSFRTVEPSVVLEVAFNNVMRSDRHASGFALRFPRILRIRDDKPVAEIDTLERVETIYASQPDKPTES